jgi:tetratricopeptide (TPR) repeat protein
MKHHFKFFLLFVCFLNISQNIHAQENRKSYDQEVDSYLSKAKSLYTNNLDSADFYSTKAKLIASKHKLVNKEALAEKFLGITDYFRHDYDAAYVHYMRALELFESKKSLKEMANVYNNIALVYQDQNQWAKAIQVHEKSLEIRKQMSDIPGIINSYNNMGNLYTQMGNDSLSISTYQQAISLTEGLVSEESIATLYSNLGLAYKKQGDYVQAENYMIKSIHSLENSKDIRYYLNTLSNLGNLYISLGEHEKGLNQLEKAMQVAIKNELHEQEATIKLNAGNVYLKTLQLGNAKDFYKDALEKYMEIGDANGLIKCLINLSIIQKMNQNYDSSQMLLTKALDFTRNNNLLIEQITIENYLTSLYLDQGKLDQAKKHLSILKDLISITDNKEELHRYIRNTANYYYLENNLIKSLEYSREALNISKELQFISSQIDDLLLLSRIEEEAGNYKQSLIDYKQMTHLKDSVFNIEKQKQITTVEGRLRLQNKDQLISKQEQIIQQKDKLAKQENQQKILIGILAMMIIGTLLLIVRSQRIRREKERISFISQNLEVERDLLQLQMNPHFIFNAMNSIQAFISGNNSRDAEIFLSRFARLMRFYLESSSKKWIELEDELEALKLNMELEQLRSNHSFSFLVDIDPNLETKELLVPPMIIQPFVENAIKHGLRTIEQDGRLHISIKTIEGDSNMVQCMVEDNGIGRKEAMRIKAAEEHHISKGMELTKQRLKARLPKQYHHQLIIYDDLMDDQGKSAGTRVNVLLPVNFD